MFIEDFRLSQYYSILPSDNCKHIKHELRTQNTLSHTFCMIAIDSMLRRARGHFHYFSLPDFLQSTLSRAYTPRNIMRVPHVWLLRIILRTLASTRRVIFAHARACPNTSQTYAILRGTHECSARYSCAPYALHTAASAHSMESEWNYGWFLDWLMNLQVNCTVFALYMSHIMSE